MHSHDTVNLNRSAFRTAIAFAIAALCALIAAESPAGEAIPVGFCRGGERPALRLADAPAGQAVLRAFGRDWAEVERDGERRGTVRAPEVRVPTLFTIETSNRPIGELIVYPAQHAAEWDAELLVCVGDDVPAWFAEWLSALGVPHRIVETPSLTAEKLSRILAERKARRIVVAIGARNGGSEPEALARRQRQVAAPMVAFDLSWFGPPLEERTTLHATAAGSEIVAASGPRALAEIPVTSRRSPWNGVARRVAWLATPDGQPVIEAAAGPLPGHPLVFSYLPWQRILGRYDGADDLLLGVLRKAAAPAKPWPRPAVLRLLLPEGTMVESATRPVLTRHAAWLKESDQSVPERSRPFHDEWPTIPNTAADIAPPEVLLVDLRGPAVSRGDAERVITALESSLGRQPVVILGEDSAIDARLDELAKRIAEKRRPAALHRLPADDLPPGDAHVVELVLLLTRLGVDLGPIPEQKPNSPNH